MTEFEKAVAQQVAPLAGLTEDQVLECIEEPKNISKADLAIPVGKLSKFKKFDISPAQLASEWKAKITPTHHIVSATSEGPYLNFSLNRTAFMEHTIRKVFAAGDSWGSSPDFGAGKTVVIEYSSPNIAKPFHVGHLRTTIYGNFLKNLHNMLGFKTTGINYLGDWGKQYGLLALGFEKYGSEEELVANPIKHLFDIYVKINNDKDAEKEQEEKEQQERIAKGLPEDEGTTKAPNSNDQARVYFKRMEDGDPTLLAQWRRFRDLSIEEYKNVYKRLNSEFEVYSGESQQTEGMVRVVKELEEQNLLVDDGGAKFVQLPNFKPKGADKAYIKTSEGATLYLARDLAAAISRYEEYHFDQMYYVVCGDQDVHFKRLFKILDLMGKSDIANKSKHLGFGKILKMSTRKGTVVFLADILNEIKEKMLEVMASSPKSAEIVDPEETAYIVGLSALVVQDFSWKRTRDIENYDIAKEQLFSLEGNTGPYVQYQHARLCSLESRAKVRKSPDIDYSLLNEQVAYDLVRLISKYPAVVINAKHTLDPTTVIAYLFELTHQVQQTVNGGLWVNSNQTVTVAEKLAEARVTLFWAARVTIASALRLIGLTPLERV